MFIQPPPPLPEVLRRPFNDNFTQRCRNFYAKCCSLAFQRRCMHCCEQFVGIQFIHSNCCKRCNLDRRQPKRFSAGNELCPGVQPPELRDLTVAEQMLIAPYLAVVLVYRLAGQGQLSTRGHGIIFPQDQANVVQELPRRTLPVVLIRCVSYTIFMCITLLLYGLHHL